jgi:hypothetical protein
LSTTTITHQSEILFYEPDTCNSPEGNAGSRDGLTSLSTNTGKLGNRGVQLVNLGLGDSRGILNDTFETTNLPETTFVSDESTTRKVDQNAYELLESCWLAHGETGTGVTVGTSVVNGKSGGTVVGTRRGDV